MTTEKTTLDPVNQALPHLVFLDEGSKLVGTILKSSKYYDSKFRSFAYKEGRSSVNAKTAICMEFYEKKILERN